MEQIIGGIVCGIFALTSLILSVTQFLEIGNPLNNAWLYASQTQREQMDPGPLFRQSAIVFAMIAAVFLLLLVQILSGLLWLFFPVTVLTIAMLIYAIVSSVKRS